MGLPKISVVIPSYNQAKFIGGTIQSVISQDYPNLELIIIDGGSADGSVDIIKKYKKFIAYSVSEADDGQTDALVKGFSRSSGDIQCWLNSDDLLVQSALGDVADYFTKRPDVDAVFGDTEWIDENGDALRRQREIPFNWFIWLYTYNYIPGMSMFWRRKLYEKVGGLNRKYQLAMDADLWARFAEAGCIMHSRKTWSQMRFYPSQKNQRLRAQSDAEDLEIRSRYWGGATPPPLYGLKKTTAHLLRVGWRLLMGCYHVGYRKDLSKR